MRQERSTFRFVVLTLLVAATSFFAAAGVARLVRSGGGGGMDGSPWGGVGGGPAESGPTEPVASFEALLDEAGLAPTRLATFWVHPECVACFHYLGSMLWEVEEQRRRGGEVVFVVLGTEDEARRLTRFFPEGVRTVYDSAGALFRETGVTITPQFLHFDREGRVVRHGRGPTRWGRRPLDPDGPRPEITGTEVR